MARVVQYKCDVTKKYFSEEEHYKQQFRIVKDGELGIDIHPSIYNKIAEILQMGLHTEKKDLIKKSAEKKDLGVSKIDVRFDVKTNRPTGIKCRRCGSYSTRYICCNPRKKGGPSYKYKCNDCFAPTTVDIDGNLTTNKKSKLSEKYVRTQPSKGVKFSDYSSIKYPGEDCAEDIKTLLSLNVCICGTLLPYGEDMCQKCRGDFQ